MTREDAISWLKKIKIKYIHGGDEEFDAQRRKALDMAISALREQETVTNRNGLNGWISVKDRLPKDWKEKGGDLINYLVFMPEYGVDVGNYAKPVKTWLCMGIPCKVTHWMPLPETPKGETT